MVPTETKTPAGGSVANEIKQNAGPAASHGLSGPVYLGRTITIRQRLLEIRMASVWSEKLVFLIYSITRHTCRLTCEGIQCSTLQARACVNWNLLVNVYYALSLKYFWCVLNLLWSNT